MTAPKLALVTGGRNFRPTAGSRERLGTVLDDVALLLEGEAYGFDRFVRDFVRARNQSMPRGQRIVIQPCPAFWDLAARLERPVGAEGPIRNRRMRKWADQLAGFYDLEPVLIKGPGGTGTADMRKVCDDLEVREIPGMLVRPR